MVSEGDLVRRVETGTEPDAGKSWWLDLFTSPATRQEQFIKSHGRRAEDVMTRNPLTIKKDTSLAEIATVLETNRIKRVPVLEDEQVVGIVSRANLLHGLVVSEAAEAPLNLDDRMIREAILHAVHGGVATGGSYVNVVVRNGIAKIIGSVNSDREERAILIAAETTAGVKSVENKLGRVPVWVYGY